MLREASALPAGTTIECDVCVVGAGAAGIALGLELAGRGQRVCLLEAGGHALQSAVQDLHRGAEGAQAFFGSDDYVWSSRLRFLGGSTNHWDGECEPLEPGDLATREWVPHSGWPLSFDDLSPWYARAAPWLELPEGAEAGAAQAAAAAPGFETPTRYWSAPTRFGARYRAQLEAAPNVDLLLHANAVALEANEAGSKLERVAAVALPGMQRFSVRARDTVLACGALENARLLLASAAKLGNAHDRVGRYFMDALEGRVAEVVGLEARGDPAGDDRRRQHLLAPSFAVQRERALLAARFRLEPVPARPAGLVGELGTLVAGLAGAAAAQGDPTQRLRISRAVIGSEMAPNPENRVRLSEERDALGLPRLALDAAPGPLEQASIASATRALALALGAGLSARVQIELDEQAPWQGLAPAQQPCGTTRMHADPARGVVDADCRVHGVANLFIAGSSVFTTGGRGRPTWTLLALALRLADHLVQRARAGE